MLPRLNRDAFTLVEMLVAMTVTTAMIVILLQVVTASSTQWQSTTENTQAFQSARAAFETVTRTLSQATLNVEYDYYDALRQSRTALASESTSDADWDQRMASFTPDRYGRSSNLHFLSGKRLITDQHTHSLFFQAPLDYDASGNSAGAQGQLNAIGFFIRYEDDSDDVPDHFVHFPRRHRYRLMQFLQPASKMDTYRSATTHDWFQAPINASPRRDVHLLAENIIALAVLPKLADHQSAPDDAIAPGFEYDSRTPWGAEDQPIQMHQLPPVVRVIMVAIDEVSAQRHPHLGTSAQALFQRVDQLADDLELLEAELTSLNVNYRIFQADVAIRAAKWSQ